MINGRLTLKDLAKALEQVGVGKSTQTLRRYEKLGKVKFPRDPLSNHRVFTPEDIQRFVELFRTR